MWKMAPVVRLDREMNELNLAGDDRMTITDTDTKGRQDDRPGQTYYTRDEEKGRPTEQSLTNMLNICGTDREIILFWLLKKLKKEKIANLAKKKTTKLTLGLGDGGGGRDGAERGAPRVRRVHPRQSHGMAHPRCRVNGADQLICR